MLKDIFQKNKKYATLPQQQRPLAQITPSQPVNKVEIPQGIIDKCPKCKEIVYTKELENNQKVCPKCQFHHALSSQERIAMLLDEGSFEEFDQNLTSENPLEFPDYVEKVASDQKKTGISEAVVTGKGTIENLPLVIGVMDSRFRMGSMGSVVGEKIARAIEKAIELRVPFILFCASGGARMQEGVLSLMQMAKTSAALKKLSNAGLLFIPILTNPTTGGVSASFAMLGDMIFAEPGALIGFAGRRVIEQTIRQTLPDDFQTSEFLLAHGQLDKVIHRKQLKETLREILEIHAETEEKHE